MKVILVTNSGTQQEIDMPVIPRVGDTIYTENMLPLYAPGSDESEFWKVDEVRFCVKSGVFTDVVVLISNLY